MIMGMELMKYIGIKVDCEQRCIRWGGTYIPLKTRNTLSDNEILHMLYYILQKMNQISCKKQKRERIAS
jgi:hypothetical protein